MLLFLRGIFSICCLPCCLEVRGHGQQHVVGSLHEDSFGCFDMGVKAQRVLLPAVLKTEEEGFLCISLFFFFIISSKIRITQFTGFFVFVFQFVCRSSELCDKWPHWTVGEKLIFEAWGFTVKATNKTEGQRSMKDECCYVLCGGGTAKASRSVIYSRSLAVHRTLMASWCLWVFPFHQLHILCNLKRVKVNLVFCELSYVFQECQLACKSRKKPRSWCSRKWWKKYLDQ